MLVECSRELGYERTQTRWIQGFTQLTAAGIQPARFDSKLADTGGS
jgi:hypothetical protein